MEQVVILHKKKMLVEKVEVVIYCNFFIINKEQMVLRSNRCFQIREEETNESKSRNEEQKL